ncbi:phage minor head protein [Virgibacillus doumboii]|uniref:phage head morphogenesis protein n=1 Tax=Virgibacillus doumboii TaxID=2697503 RepID=UPI0013DF50D2|nr:phage minor head protein [Virgibacillus doumboii]
MNQLEIEEYLDKLAEQTGSEIEEVIVKRLKVIQNRIAQMYAKYADSDGELSWTDINKYNRFQKEMKQITKELNADYRYIIKKLQKSNENIYLEGFMRHMYLYEMATGKGMYVSIPSTETIKGILLNPIAELTLSKIFEQHRNEIVRKINIELGQGIQAGEGYATMAKRIEKTVGFSRNKARRVARTEGGRARTIAGEEAEKKASKHVDITSVWMSALDLRVRHSHRVLDGQKTDDEGYFHYRSWKAKAPHLWGIPSMDINCRCVKLRLVNGMLPEYRRGRDYMDPEYQRKLADRIEKYMADDARTYKQALKRAKREIKPPSTTMLYTTFDDWYKKHAL